MTKTTIARVTRFYIRHYRDNGSTVAYCEWIDSKGQRGRTEGDMSPALTVPARFGTHITCLGLRAIREGLTVQFEIW